MRLGNRIIESKWDYAMPSSDLTIIGTMSRSPALVNSASSCMHSLPLDITFQGVKICGLSAPDIEQHSFIRTSYDIFAH